MALTWTLAYLLSEWAIRLAMLVYVPQKRSPAAARSWLLLIFVLPWPGLILYGLFGRPYLPRRRVEMQRRVSQLIKTARREMPPAPAPQLDLPPNFMQAVALAQQLGDFAIGGGNRLELLQDYNGAIDRLVADIHAAQRHVHL